MNKAYPHLLIFVLLLVLTPGAWAQKLSTGNFVAKIDGININYTIEGKGPVMIVGHPTSGKIGYELSLKPLENRFTRYIMTQEALGNLIFPLLYLNTMMKI